MSFTKINHYEKEYADTHHDTALNVTEGVEDQPIVSPYFTRRKKRRLSTDEYVEGILAGNITTLSQAITLVESNNPAHYAQAQEIIERCLPHRIAYPAISSSTTIFCSRSLSRLP